MAPGEDTLRRLDDLVAEADRVAASHRPSAGADSELGYREGYVDESLLSAWRVSALAFVCQLVGEQSPYYIELSQYADSSYFPSFRKARATLRRLRDDFAQGHVRAPAGAASAGVGSEGPIPDGHTSYRPASQQPCSPGRKTAAEGGASREESGKPRRFWSQRSEGASSRNVNLPLLRRLLLSTYEALADKGAFEESMGYSCAYDSKGTMGSDIGAYLFRKLRRDYLWPIYEHHTAYTETDVFDMIELLYDHVSQGVGDRRYCGWDSCEGHFSSFDKDEGKREWRSEVNAFLCDYGAGYELSADGEVLALAPEGMEELLQEDLPPYAPDKVDNRVSAAVRKFRRHHASEDERREAVRALAGVLEFLRPDIRRLPMSKDEDDLFSIANNFGIRHHNPKQRTQYEAEPWLTWMFYAYLSTIRLVLRTLTERGERDADGPWDGA